MKPTNCNFKRNGFLLIELLLALGILSSTGLMLSLYQVRVRLYRQAAAQIYRAMYLAADSLDKLQAAAASVQCSDWQDGPYHITLKIIPQAAWQQVIVTVGWQNAFDRPQQIVWEGACLG